MSVFVNDAKDPCLVVNLLNDRKKGLVGLWVGNNSGGDFANFNIIPSASPAFAPEMNTRIPRVK